MSENFWQSKPACAFGCESLKNKQTTSEFLESQLENLKYKWNGFVDTVVIRDEFGNFYQRENGNQKDFEGVNCQWVVAEYFYRLFGFDLSKSLNASQFSYDLTHNIDLFEDIKDGECLKKGDVLIFSSGRKIENSQSQFCIDRWNHVGVFTGSYNESNQPMILHGNFAMGHSTVETLSQLLSYTKKSGEQRWVLKKIRRFKFNPF